MNEKHIKKLILHIGLPKTGTKALQRFLRDNRTLLLEKRVLYPSPPPNIHRAYGVPFEGTEPLPLEPAWEKVRDLFQKDVDSVIVSHEDLSIHISNDPEKFLQYVVNLFSKFGIIVQVIVYLRRQDMHYESLYNQDVKYFCTKRDFDPYPQDGLVICSNGFNLNTYYYDAWIKRVAGVIGKENTIVRIYDRSLYHGDDIYHDFMFSIGIEFDERFSISITDPNPGVDSQYLELCRFANYIYAQNEKTRQDVAVKKLFYQFILRVNMEIGVTGDKRIFSDEERRVFLERFFDSNNRLFDFLGAKNVFLDENACPPGHHGGRPDLDVETYKLIVALLHRRWLECACNMRFPIRNYLRIKHAQVQAKNGIPGAKRKLFVYRIIHSIGKRIVPGWLATGKMELLLDKIPHAVADD